MLHRYATAQFDEQHASRKLSSEELAAYVAVDSNGVSDADSECRTHVRNTCKQLDAQLELGKLDLGPLKQHFPGKGMQLATWQLLCTDAGLALMKVVHRFLSSLNVPVSGADEAGSLDDNNHPFRTNGKRPANTKAAQILAAAAAGDPDAVELVEQYGLDKPSNAIDFDAEDGPRGGGSGAAAKRARVDKTSANAGKLKHRGDGAGILGDALKDATAAQSSSQLEAIKLQMAANAETFKAATLATQQLFQQQLAADKAVRDQQRLDDLADENRRRDEREKATELRREANNRRYQAQDTATAKNTLDQSLQKAQDRHEDKSHALAGLINIEADGNGLRGAARSSFISDRIKALQEHIDRTRDRAERAANQSFAATMQTIQAAYAN